MSGGPGAAPGGDASKTAENLLVALRNIDARLAPVLDTPWQTTMTRYGVEYMGIVHGDRDPSSGCAA
jgi:hypothetical protein